MLVEAIVDLLLLYFYIDEIFNVIFKMYLQLICAGVTCIQGADSLSHLCKHMLISGVNLNILQKEG